jgi:hypothetical protein
MTMSGIDFAEAVQVHEDQGIVTPESHGTRVLGIQGPIEKAQVVKAGQIVADNKLA